MLDYLLSSNFGTDMLWFMELLFAVHAVISTDIPMFGTCSTIWLFNIANLKITMFNIGKPSISMGHLYHGYVK